jgi:hypothetical protein
MHTDDDEKNNNNNNNNNDDNPNELSAHHHLVRSSSSSSSSSSLSSSVTHLVKISYTKSRIKVYFVDFHTPLLTAKLSNSLHSSFYLGFLSSTSAECHDRILLSDWYFERLSAQVLTHSSSLLVSHGIAHSSSLTQINDVCEDGFVGQSCGLNMLPMTLACLGQTTSGCGTCIRTEGCGW